MFMFLAILGLVLEGVTWVLVFGFGVWVYRRLHLRSLPWLGAYAALTLSLGHVTSALMRMVIDGRLAGGLMRGEFLVMWFFAGRIMDHLAGLLVAVLIMAEVAGLVARALPGPESRPARLLRAVRETPMPLGAALIGLVLAQPLAATMLWLSGHVLAAGRVAAGWF